MFELFSTKQIYQAFKEADMVPMPGFYRMEAFDNRIHVGGCILGALKEIYGAESVQSIRSDIHYTITTNFDAACRQVRGDHKDSDIHRPYESVDHILFTRFVEVVTQLDDEVRFENSQKDGTTK